MLPSFVAISTVGGNIMVFFSHVTLQDHMIKALNYFIVRRPSRYATILTSLVFIGTVVVKILYI